MTHSAKAYIILVNYNGWKDSVACIESLIELHHDVFQIVVVDNCSGDESAAQLADYMERRNIASKSISETELDACYSRASRGSPAREETKDLDVEVVASDTKVIILQSDRNRGFAGGNNVGIRYCLAKGDSRYIWLLNNDTIVHEDALNAMILEIDRSDHEGVPTAMCGSVILDFHQRSTIQAYGGGNINRYLGTTRPLLSGKELNSVRDMESIRTPDYLVGCSLLVKSEYLDAIGLMDEYYFLYWEDTEWSYRCKELGFGLTVAADSIVWHRKGSTTKRFPVSGFYNSRNCLIFMKKYFPWHLISCLVLRPFVSVLILLRNFDVRFFRESIRGYISFLSVELRS